MITLPSLASLRMHCRLTLLAPLCAAGALAGTAGAQTILHTFTGSTTNGQFGNAVACAGDVDADGFPDLIVGSQGFNVPGTDTGAAFVYSGRTGNLLLSWQGEAGGDKLGCAVDGAGDVNGDGHDDVLVGEYRHDAAGLDSGRAFVFSGADGSVLLVLDGPGPDSEFGIGVAGLGDIDGDGLSDVAIGSHHDNTNGHHAGSVRVYSGASGSQLHAFFGDEIDDDLGHVLSGIDDIDGDGVRDLIAGLHDNPDPGQARVYSLGSFTLLYGFTGNSAGDFFGHAVGSPGDTDGDGVAELLVGAQLDDTAASGAGRAWLRSGASGGVLFDWVGDAAMDSLGASVAGAGDWDGDGVRDILVAIPGDDPNGAGSGAARFYSGADGSILLTFDGNSPGLRFAVEVSQLGDVNGDGRPDVAIGFPYHDQAGSDAGLVLVVSGALPTWVDAGGGLAGANGIPRLSGQGLLASGTPGALSLKAAAPLAPTLLFASLGSTPVTFKGGVLAAFPPILQLPLATNAAGQFTLPWASWPAGVPQVLLHFQCALLDAGAIKGASLSNLLTGATK